MVANAASMKINRSNIGLRLLSKAPPAPDYAATPRAILAAAPDFGELAAMHAPPMLKPRFFAARRGKVL